MAGIDIYRLIQWESDIAAIERPIRRRVERGQGRLRQACYELLDPANSHRRSSRISRTGSVPKVQICARESVSANMELTETTVIITDGVVEASPLLLGEELAESGVAQRDGFVRT